MHFNEHKRPIIVKFMARMPQKTTEYRFLRQFPKCKPEWGNCRYIFDTESKEYDWLVVYHDIHRKNGEGQIESLQCPRENTILITTEPSTITVYGSDYLQQFGTIITSQEPWAIPHPNPIFCQPDLIWFYGCKLDIESARTYDEISTAICPVKDKLISTVCSNKRGWLTLHDERFLFTEKLKSQMQELNIYGHGINPISDKAEAMDAYKYFITIENHVYPHHITEKLTDSFLGYTLPFYHGCPNAADYFPKESFIPIDINNFKRAVDIIKSTIANNEFENRLPYIIEARQRVLKEHNIFALLDRQITDTNHSKKTDRPYGEIMDRKTLRLKKLPAGIRSQFEKIIIKGRHRINRYFS